MLLSALTKKYRETRLWQFEPSAFQRGPQAGFLERHVLGRARSLGKYTLYALAFAYPVLLVILGVVFGGLVFWTSFAGSAGLIWLIIKKAGYSQNFAAWDIGYKKFLGLIGGFGGALVFVSAIIYIKTWPGLVTGGMVYGITFLKACTVPIIAGMLAVALIVGVWKTSAR